MEIFIFSGKGLALGATIVVVAQGKTAAKKLAVEWAKSNNVHPSTLILLKRKKLEVPGVIYGWNGDY